MPGSLAGADRSEVLVLFYLVCGCSHLLSIHFCRRHSPVCPLHHIFIVLSGPFVTYFCRYLGAVGDTHTSTCMWQLYRIQEWRVWHNPAIANLSPGHRIGDPASTIIWMSPSVHRVAVVGVHDGSGLEIWRLDRAVVRCRLCCRPARVLQ